MAIAKESGFGASGKIGDVVFRRRKSGTVIASQPIKRGTPTHPRQIKSNQKFRFCKALFIYKKDRMFCSAVEGYNAAGSFDE